MHILSLQKLRFLHEYEHRLSVYFAKQSGALKILRPYEKSLRFEAHFEG